MSSSNLASRKLYTTGHLAHELGLGTSMARRYGLALEAATGKPLRQVPGKGRMYSETDIQLLREARQVLMEQPSLSIEEVLRGLLGTEKASEPQVEAQDTKPTVEKASRPPESSPVALVDLQEALTQALAPVAAALQDLRQENQQLRLEIEGLKALPAPPSDAVEAERRYTEKMLELYRATLEGKSREIEELRKRPRWWWPW